MSRVGKVPIILPKGVSVDIKSDIVAVKGPKGELTQEYKPKVEFLLEGENLVVKRLDDAKETRAMHGLYRSLLNNMVIGVSDGFKKTLEINGVGYRAEPKGSNLLFNLGYSTQIEYEPPQGITLAVEGKGGTVVVVSGIDKQKVGLCASEIVSLRPPEPYKGKGIKYADQQIRRKVGKAGLK